MDYQKILQERKTYSEEILNKLRKAISHEMPSGIGVVVSGSFARKEAWIESDVDYFILIDDESGGCVSEDTIEEAHSKIARAIGDLKLKNPALAGSFGNKSEKLTDFFSNVGGNDDSNEKLTRRLLLLFEGEWLYNEKIFCRVREKLISDVYVRPAISDHQIARFLLNDLIRYWRTIGVDFEFKTVEAGKSWGIRNIKLVYSRKLMYFSGLLMVAETAQSTRKTKVDRLLELAALTPLERIESILGSQCSKINIAYAHFLTQIGDEKVRKTFEKVTLDRVTQIEDFKRLKNAGQLFSLQLEQLLKSNYPPSHPIHHALLF